MKIDQLAEHLTIWIKNTVISAGCNGVIFGMSGGIDSSVLAILCKKSFPDTCLGIIMPCLSDKKDRLHAEMIAKQYSISTRLVVLDDIYNNLLTILPGDEISNTRGRLAKSNIKPRLRMLVLYYFANQLNYLVVGSSNRCELYIGYFTKHGDGAVDVAPLANLVKTQIKQLALYLGISDEIINKPPSAGLWKGQTDEQEMGLSYDQIDKYILTGKSTIKIKNRIEILAKRNLHKSISPIMPPVF